MADFIRITEEPSKYRHLDRMPIEEILENINKEDQTVPQAVAKAIPQIRALTEAVADKMLSGGRLFLYWRRHQWQAGRSRCQ